MHNFFSNKSKQDLIKCDLTLIDDSETEIIYTIWGTTAENATIEYVNNPIVAIHHARVSNYNGKTIGSATNIMINPMHLNEAQRLLKWWEDFGCANINNTTTKSLIKLIPSLINRKYIKSIKSEHIQLNKSNTTEWVTFKGICSFIKKFKEGGAWYPVCQNKNEPCCNLYKVIQLSDGNWQCPKCFTLYNKPLRHWIFSAVIKDTTGSTWVSFFNDQAKQLLDGISADEAYEISYNNPANNYNFDQDAYDSIFANAIGTEAIFKCKVKNEINRENGVSRVKVSVDQLLLKIDYCKESTDMLKILLP
jgi:replication factor A1